MLFQMFDTRIALARYPKSNFPESSYEAGSVCTSELGPSLWDAPADIPWVALGIRGRGPAARVSAQCKIQSQGSWLR